jgi:hypothetical protein
MRIKLTLSFLVFIIFSNAQTVVRKNNSIYAEFLGNGGSVVSLNYERLFHFKKTNLMQLSSRIGFSFSSHRYDHAAMYNIPMEFTTLLGRKKHLLEIGFGWTAFIGTSNLKDTIIPKGYRTNFDYTYFIRVGYRFISDNGLLLRIAPLIGLGHNPPQSKVLTLVPGFGLSIGYCFNFRKSFNYTDGYSE